MRYWLRLFCLLLFCSASYAGEPIVLGQSGPLSGPLGVAGRSVKAGMDAYLARVQREGGIAGRQVVLRMLDDAYSVERHVANVRQLLEEDRVAALVLSAGTSHIDAAYPVVQKSGKPLIGTMSGAMVLRDAQRSLIYHLRASYADEVRRLVAQVQAVKQSRVFAVWQDDGLGRDAFDALEAALKATRITLVGQQSVSLKSMDAATVAAAVRAAQPDALFILCVTPCAAKVLSGVGSDGSYRFTPYALSIVNGEMLSSTVGQAARGTVISQVMPNPHLPSTPLVQRYQQDMRRFSEEEKFSYFSLEGYVAAMVAVEAARVAYMSTPHRSMEEAMRQLLRREIHGVPISRAGAPGVRPHSVTLSMIGWNGKLVH